MTDPPPAATASAGVKGETRVEEPTGRQRAIARRTAEARATVPHLELTVDVDVSHRLAAGDPVTASVVWACAVALRDCPRANAAYRDGRFELYSRVNVGLVVDAGDDFLVPTVFDADRKSIAELSGEIELLIERAGAGALTPPELAGATFTLTDMSTSGVRSLFPVPSPPHAAAVAAGTVREAPVVRDGALAPGRLTTLTLTCDGRILFGSRAAAFLVRIKQLLEEAGR
jgi:pyruvate dehydrogenase E2 component (dihydrolipoamide acetyltransferase)